MQGNLHTTKILDIVCNFDNDFLFVVMEYVDSDLKKIMTSSRNIEFND